MNNFYYPNGEEITGDDRIEKFIEEYNRRYYIGGESGTGNRCMSGYVENVIDGLLQNGIQNKRDVLRILGWKMGKIRHKDTEDAFKNERGIKEPSKKDYDEASGEICFIYNEDWKDAEKWEKEVKEKDDPNLSIADLTLKRWNQKIEITKLVDFIVSNKERLYKEAIDNPQRLLKEIISTKPKQMGAVYIVTLLYFLSKAEYPIFDQFAERALNAIFYGKAPKDQIFSKTELPNKDDPKFAEKLMEPNSAYMFYKESIEDVFGDYEKNYRASRDIDRALWVYGHLFDPTHIEYPSVWDWFQNWYLDISERRFSTESDIVISTQPYEDEDSYPGYCINIDLTDTEWEDKPFETINAEQPPHNFMNDTHMGWKCWKEGSVFMAFTELLSLENVLEVFRAWIESDKKEA